MKIFYLALFTIPFSLTSTAQSSTSKAEVQNISTFIEVWGFLKYHHPNVAKVKFDWDWEFLTRVDNAATLKTKKETSDFYIDWINSLGKMKPCKNCRDTIASDLTQNFNLDGIRDSTRFSPALLSQLDYIYQNRHQGANHYVKENMFIGCAQVRNEKPYKDSIYPGPEMRLLSLARYWNFIQYFFPYKYITDTEWRQVLPAMIPGFLHAADTLSYHLAIAELVASTDDGHAEFITRRMFNEYRKWAPFEYKLLDDVAIVTLLENDSLCRLNDIRRGDVFLEVDGKLISEIIKVRAPFIAASNDAALLSYMNFHILNGRTDSVKVKFERNGVVTEKYLYRYYRDKIEMGYTPAEKEEAFSTLPGNTGYINMGLLKRKDVKGAMKSLWDTKAIIFDVRNYPLGTVLKISRYLNAERVPFAKFTVPVIHHPGVFKWTKPMKAGRRKKNPDPYKGLVVLLQDETTQSHAEFTLMALRTAPRVLSVGSQTAGADGNAPMFIFPGNFETYMSGIGVYYPDGTETQRIGIVPDILVKPTIRGIREGRDEVLERAIEEIGKRVGE